MERTGLTLIITERTRQIQEEKFGSINDEKLVEGELIKAAIMYAATDEMRDYHRLIWPFSLEFWKPTPNDRVRELTKAGALIAAEIDRELAILDKTKTPEQLAFEKEWDIVETKFIKKHGNWQRILTTKELRELHRRYQKLKLKYNGTKQ